MVASESDSMVSRSHVWPTDMTLWSNSPKACKDTILSSHRKLPTSTVARNTRRKDFSVHHDKSSCSVGEEIELVDVVTTAPSPPSCKGLTSNDDYVDENLCKHKLLSSDTQWKTIEKGHLDNSIHCYKMGLAIQKQILGKTDLAENSWSPIEKVLYMEGIDDNDERKANSHEACEAPYDGGFHSSSDFTVEVFQKYADAFNEQYFRISEANARLSDGHYTTCWGPSEEEFESDYWRIVEKMVNEIEVLYGADEATAKFLIELLDQIGSGVTNTVAGLYSSRQCVWLRLSSGIEEEDILSGFVLCRVDRPIGALSVFNAQFQILETVDYIWLSEELIPVDFDATLPIHILKKTGGLPSGKSTLLRASCLAVILPQWGCSISLETCSAASVVGIVVAWLQERERGARILPMAAAKDTVVLEGRTGKFDNSMKLFSDMKQQGVDVKGMVKGGPVVEDVPPLLEMGGKVEVWGSNGSAKTPIPKAEMGKFYSGGCYIVLYTYHSGENKGDYFLCCWMDTRRQCSCFAADTECNPDVCRNCRVGCGDAPDRRVRVISVLDPAHLYRCISEVLVAGLLGPLFKGRQGFAGVGDEANQLSVLCKDHHNVLVELVGYEDQAYVHRDVKTSHILLTARFPT